MHARCTRGGVADALQTETRAVENGVARGPPVSSAGVDCPVARSFTDFAYGRRAFFMTQGDGLLMVTAEDERVETRQPPSAGGIEVQVSIGGDLAATAPNGPLPVRAPG